MKQMTVNMIGHHCRTAVLVCAMLLCSVAAMAQITSVHGTVSDDFGPLMGAAICEIDGNGRIIESTITDMNGNFNMKVKNPKNKLRISFVGLKTQTFSFDKTTYNVKMESSTTLQEVTVKSKKRMQGNSLPIPEREVSFARQSIDAKEFEGLGITSVDEALQGRIAGLDIVANSGNLGAGSVMKLRNSTSLSGLTNEQPLIVVDGNVRDDLDMTNFDVTTANEEKFSELLNVNTEDIASINVIKDGAGAAIYGSQGGNGVIEITTKRGTKGKPRLTYTFKLTGKYQPKGMELLSGDDYTMLLKESYFNPQQNDATSNIPEINYLGSTWKESNQYDDNTDWRDAVTQWGFLQNHYITISGGGEKALFRISGGFDNETGSVIAQKMNRFSTRVNLDYNVSERIRVQTNFAMTYTKNYMNYDNLLEVAQKKMPNMSIYEEDIYGNDTDTYYNMLQSGLYKGCDVFKDDQRVYVNPVASAYLAKNIMTTYDLNPELVLNYELLGLDEDHHRLTWRGQVYMRISNRYTDKFYPSELVTTEWQKGVNNAFNENKKDVSLTTKHTLTFIPSFNNKDHSLLAMGRMELSTWNSNGQSTSATGLPSGGIESPYAGGKNNGLSSWFSEGRSLFFTFSTHYAYKSRYMADFTLRADGTTKFGPDNRWGYFPSVSLRWNVIDEPFMERFRGWLSMLSIRPSWAYTGSAPNKDYLYTSKYASASQYLDMSAMYPTNLKLTNLKWQKSNKYNLGFDLGFMSDKLNVTFEMYNETVSDILMPNFRIPSNTGFATVDYRNDGKMRNTGWEFHVNTNKLLKIGKFTMDINANFSNSKSRILEMDETLLANKNTTFNNENNQIMERVQLNNPNNSIYGFRYKGVYQYQYDTFKDITPQRFKEIYDKKGMSYDAGQVDAMTQQQLQEKFIADGLTVPVAQTADGRIIRNDKGEPVRMVFAYSNDGSGVNGGSGYKFYGGDAMYEDVNNDGQINALDIVYLGSSLPKLMGGFGFAFTYGDWRLSTQFSYRLGFKIINRARLYSEAMINNDNQSQAVNYRWRKEGDETTIPRAMYGKDTNYNTLLSDRFVEDGDYLRMTYAQLSYTLKKKYLKWIGLNKVSFYVSANNPFVITSYTGVDPDISAAGTSPAIDYGQTPRAKSYTFGMTVDF